MGKVPRKGRDPRAHGTKPMSVKQCSNIKELFVNDRGRRAYLRPVLAAYDALVSGDMRPRTKGDK